MFISYAAQAIDKNAAALIRSHNELIEVGADQIENYLWNPSKTALAFCTLEQPNSCYIVDSTNVADVTAMEASNLGKLGFFSRKSYDKVVSLPVKWLKTENGLHLVMFKTQAWRNGQRYTVKEPTLAKNGKYSGR